MLHKGWRSWPAKAERLGLTILPDCKLFMHNEMAKLKNGKARQQ